MFSIKDLFQLFPVVFNRNTPFTSLPENSLRHFVQGKLLATPLICQPFYKRMVTRLQKGCARVVTKVANTYLIAYQANFDIEAKIDNIKKQIRDLTTDEKFVDSYEIINTLIAEKLGKKIDELSLETDDKDLARQVKNEIATHNHTLLIGVAQVNTGLAFVNLLNEIKNLNKQTPTLSDVFIYFGEKIGPDLLTQLESLHQLKKTRQEEEFCQLDKINELGEEHLLQELTEWQRDPTSTQLQDEHIAQELKLEQEWEQFKQKNTKEVQAELDRVWNIAADKILTSFFPSQIGFLGEELLVGVEIPFKSIFAKILYQVLRENLVNVLAPNYPIIQSIAFVVNNEQKNKDLLQKNSHSNFLYHICNAISKDALTQLAKQSTIQSISEIFGLKEGDQVIASKAIKIFMEDNIISSQLEKYIKNLLIQRCNLFLEAKERRLFSSKDGAIVFVEELFKIALETFKEISDIGENITEEDAWNRLSLRIMKDLLGIGSPDDLTEIPALYREKIHLGIFQNIKEAIQHMNQSVLAIEDFNQDKIFPKLSDSLKMTLQSVADLLAQKLIVNVTDLLIVKKGEKMVPVNLISRGIEMQLEAWKNKFLIAQVLLDESLPLQEPIQEKLGEFLKELHSPTLTRAREKTRPFIKTICEVVLKKMNEYVFEAEEEHTNLSINVVKKLFEAITLHLQGIQKAKKGGDISHEKFLAETNSLHPALKFQTTTYQKSIQTIEGYANVTFSESQKAELCKKFIVLSKREAKGVENLSSRTILEVLVSIQPNLEIEVEQLKELKKILREEAEALKINKNVNFYAPLSKDILHLLFPGGAHDLQFISQPILRAEIWDLLENKLLVLLLPLVTEFLLRPKLLDQVLLKALEFRKESLRKEPILSLPPQVSALDDSLAEVLGSLIAILPLSKKLKNLIVDPNTGKIWPDMAKGIGESLQAKLQETNFLQKIWEEKLNDLLENLKKDDVEESPEAIHQKQLTLAREIADTEINRFITIQWMKFQKSFDNLVEKYIGGIGVKTKEALDVVFRFIFFSVIKEIVLVILSPLQMVIREIIYKKLVDENIKAIISLYSDLPLDQPETGEGHVLYHENLLYQIIESLKNVLEETKK